jgi:glycosyltransferase involved in cell wall biosynthesis
MKNKFIIICLSYNNKDWVSTNLESILEQTYTNYEVIYVNDASTDNTLEQVNELVGNDKRFHIISNKENLDSPTNYFKYVYEFMHNRDENEILVELCGDDWLATPTVLEQLNNVYIENDCWLTYGGMHVWNGDTNVTLPQPQNSNYSEFVHKNALYRKDQWRAGHLHSFRWFLHDKFNPKHAVSLIDSELYKEASDLQLIFSLMEMIPFNKIVNLTFPTLMFNNSPVSRSKPLKDGTFRGSNHNYENEIRNIRKKFKRFYSKEELKGELLPQVNTFGDYRERHSIPKNFSYSYNLPDGEFDMTILIDDNITKYLDGKIKINRKKPIIAILAEGPHLNQIDQSLLYKEMQQEYKKFDKVLGWHESLFNLPNFRFKPITEISQWNLLPKELDINNFKIYNKTKNISFITSTRNDARGHQFRLNCLHKIKNSNLNIDLFGRGINPIDSKLEGLKDYQFSIAMENGNMKNYFTEKILDCMLAGTVPIYHGCSNIGEFFNKEGIITFNTEEELISILSNIDDNSYKKRKSAIEENYQKALYWYEDNDKFYNKYLKEFN